MTGDIGARLRAAVSKGGRPSSDYDLNPETVLPAGRRLREAGVLVGVIERGTGPAVILTKRSSQLKHHPGQIAFPGGKVDPCDENPIAAALREAEEEVGLVRRDVEVIGTLPPHETVTSFAVTPVLARVPDSFSATPEVGEVEEVFEVPLSHFLDTRRFQVHSRLWQGRPRYYFTVPWGPFYIWGATARILRALADRVADGEDYR